MQNIIFLCIIGFAHFAVANCIFPEDPQKESGSVVKTWKARHGYHGAIDGCIVKLKLQDQSEILAFSPFSYVCEFAGGERFEFKRRTACCDSGDFGAFVCGVKPVDATGLGVSRLNASLQPLRPDARALPEVMKALTQPKSPLASEALALLKAYHATPELKLKVEAEIPRLRLIFKSKVTPYERAGMARLMLQVDKTPEDFIGLHLAVLQDPNFQLDAVTLASLKVLAEHKSESERVVRMLIEALRVARAPRARDTLVSALLGHPELIRNYLTSIHQILLSPGEASPESVKLWERLVCESLPKATPVTVSRVIFGSHEKIAPVQCGS